jgi:hypothetical protein
MKGKCLACLCGALLIWAAVDDAIAAQTPEPEDEIAAAVDNDSLQSPAVHVQVRAELQDVISACLSHAATAGIAPNTVALATAPSDAYRFVNALYSLMSLQR